MSQLKLTVLSLRYSSWSMRPWLVLRHAGAGFQTETVELQEMVRQGDDAEHLTDLSVATSLEDRRALGSVHGLFPVLRVDGVPIHESLAICEFVADYYPQAALWPGDPVERGRARAVCCEMVSGFTGIRGTLSSRLFGRVTGFSPDRRVRTEIARVFEIWDECLARSGGPFLFGTFCIADAVYFPVLARFRTYGVDVPGGLAAYAAELESLPAVQQLVEYGRRAPRIPVYDEYLIGLGGDPDAALAG